MTIRADQPAALEAAGRLRIAAVDRLLAVFAMTHSPAFVATWRGAFEKGIALDISTTLQANLPKQSAVTDTARIVLTSLPEHIDLV
jgi:hypothetical protein